MRNPNVAEIDLALVQIAAKAGAVERMAERDAFAMAQRAANAGVEVELQNVFGRSVVLAPETDAVNDALAGIEFATHLAGGAL